MNQRKKFTRYGLQALAAALLSSVCLSPGLARAQSANSDVESQLLIAILVKKGVLTHSEGESIISEARSEAAAVQASAAPVPAPVPVRAPSAVASAAPPAMPNEVETSNGDGTVHVTYIPPNVREQIAQQVESQMQASEQAKGYSAPSEVPDWVNRITIYGDVRTRYEADLYPSGNDTGGDLPNFNAINTGAPFDVSTVNQNFPPQLNANQDRNRFRLRARLGVLANLGDGWTTGLRIATGENDSPVSENQSLGTANNAQGGNFSKYSIWLDRAYIAYAPNLNPNLKLSFEFGRFDNPFFSTPLIWADDIGFDGIAATGSYKFDNDLSPFFTAGAFPVFNTDFNFASNQPNKFTSNDKYMFGLQAGASYPFNDNITAKLGIANYLFTNMQGKLSSPCTVLSAADQCDTDDDRPSFAQNGNTYMELRDIIPTVANGNGTSLQYQYFGLASRFDELALTGKVNLAYFDPNMIWIDGEWVQNLSFDKNNIASKAVNNRGAAFTGAPNGIFSGGNMGYLVSVSAGQPVLKQLWDWNASIGYRYIQTDAVVDAFNDSDFGLGGTNLKGYTLSGNLALTPSVWVRLRYMSADSIVGPTYDTDVLQLDLNAKF